MMIGHVDEQGFHELPEGEFHATGDLGYRDERGRLFLAGRAHDVMKTGGYKIYPEEIERVLPAGLVVVGIPSAHWGEVIVAVSEDGADHTAAVAAATAGLARYKQPRACLSIETIPRSLQGKVQRRARARTGARALRDDRRALSEVRTALSFHPRNLPTRRQGRSLPVGGSSNEREPARQRGNVMHRIITDLVSAGALAAAHSDCLGAGNPHRAPVLDGLPAVQRDGAREAAGEARSRARPEGREDRLVDLQRPGRDEQRADLGLDRHRGGRRAGPCHAVERAPGAPRTR